MSPLDLLLVAICFSVAGIVASVTIPASPGRGAGFLFLAAGSIVAADASFQTFVARYVETGGIPAAHLALRLDPLASFFILVIAFVAFAVGIYGLGGRNADETRTGRSAAAAACTVFLACLLICVADDALLFLFGWELLALAFYWSTSYAGTDDSGPFAGYLSLVVTHAAGAGLIAGFFIAARGAGGSLALPSLIAGLGHAPPMLVDAVFILLLIGFGAKVGMFPLHLWLRYAYPAAPSCLAALMAGGAINVGFYGITRFLVQPVTNVPLWHGIVVLALGAIGAFLGIAWGMSERDMRSLAAYSSVENAGIILAGLGAALVGRTLHLELLTGVALSAVFSKALLFLGCSSVRNSVCSTAFADLGGLSRRLPALTIAMLVAALSLAAIPPTAGYLGEWLTLETLMQAFRTGDVASQVTFALCGAMIGVAAGVAVVAFVKLLGIGFLGAPRSEAAERANEDRSAARLTAIALLAIAIVSVGVGAPRYLGLIGPAIDSTTGAAVTQAVIAESPLIQPAFHGFSSTAAGPLIAIILGFTLCFWILSQAIPRPAARTVSAWTSGETYRPWTAYTGTGFSNPSSVILDFATRIRRTITGREYELTPEAIDYSSEAQPFFGMPLYRSIGSFFIRVSDVVRATQSGLIAAYLSYILVFTIVLLILYPSIRRW
jgi:hydrogenase-4 component B